jgi:rhodanese-related sulfurtransferase
MQYGLQLFHNELRIMVLILFVNYKNHMKKTLLLLLLPLSVIAEFRSLSTQEVQAKIAQGVPIIDVRRAEEFEKFGVIPGSHKLTFFNKQGRYNIEKWLQDFSKIVKNSNDEFILVCAHANRTKTIGSFLDSKTRYNNISELAGGIKYGWIDKGLATTKIPAKTIKSHKEEKPWYQFW